jgi:glucosamine-6-phosphate isomerase
LNFRDFRGKYCPRKSRKGKEKISMISRKYHDYDSLSVATAKMIRQVILDKPDALLCFPAGETSLGTFSELIRLRETGQLDFSHCHVVGLDEWVNLGEMSSENCYHFLEKNLFAKLGLRLGQCHFFNGESKDLNNECLATENYIREKGGIDMMLLGMGMNGHLGLNEPGTSFDLYSHQVELDDVTRRVGQKYFSGKVELTRGITLGIRNIMESRLVILQVSGEQKSQVLKQLLETEVTASFPASILKEHPGSFIYYDQAADPGENDC